MPEASLRTAPERRAPDALRRSSSAFWRQAARGSWGRGYLCFVASTARPTRRDGAPSTLSRGLPSGRVRALSNDMTTPTRATSSAARSRLANSSPPRSRDPRRRADTSSLPLLDSNGWDIARARPTCSAISRNWAALSAALTPLGLEEPECEATPLNQSPSSRAFPSLWVIARCDPDDTAVRVSLGGRLNSGVLSAGSTPQVGLLSAAAIARGSPGSATVMVSRERKNPRLPMFRTSWTT